MIQFILLPLLLALVQAQEPHTSTLILTGDDQVPPVVTDVTGSALLVLSDDGESLDYTIQLLNPSNKELLGEAGAHIHCGRTSQNGAVKATLAPPGADTRNEFSILGTLTAANLTDERCGDTIEEVYLNLLFGSAYINVHSTENPSGEVRGHVDELGTVLAFELSGDAEVPPVETAVTGSVLIQESFGIMDVFLGVTNPSGVLLFGEIGAHIHCGGPDENGPVVVDLMVGDATDVTSTTLSTIVRDDDILDPACGSTVEEILTKLQAEEAYVNVHSAANPSGEVRGTAGTEAPVTFTTSSSPPPMRKSVLGAAVALWVILL